MSFALDETIAALATPVGTAALAVLRVSGARSRALFEELFGAPPEPRMARHADYRAMNGTTIDDVLATFFLGPKSYTGEDSLEISCHGNPLIAQKILEDLYARGCRPALPGEFTRRAFTHGRLDLSQAEAVMDLIAARSDRALAAANQQLRGSLGRHLETLIDDTLAALARVEAYIDFPDEDLPPEDRALVAEMLSKVSAATDRLLATQHYGDLLRDGIRTVIFGAPNAGKSSLLNRLVGRERALVSPEPGTTRDFLEERAMVGPHCIRFVDTAGLNPSPGAIERLGMRKTEEQLAEAELFLWVVDGTQPRPTLSPGIGSRLNATNALLVVNKADLPPHATHSDPSALPRIKVSAKTGHGLDPLAAAITDLAEKRRQDYGDEVIAINSRHADALRRASESLGSAGQQLKSDSLAVELLAADIRSALDALGEISGRIDNERMLDHLFATFCIGK